MKTVEWNDQLFTGEKTLDDEHLALINARNDLVVLLETNSVSMVGFLEELIKVASRHFEAEEEYLESNGYDKLAETQRQHADLSDQLQKLHQEYGKSDESEWRENLFALLGQFEKHMTDEVVEFRNFFRNRIYLEPYTADQ